MSNNATKMIRGAATVMALSMAVSSVTVTASAADNKLGGKNLAVANVESELLIRGSANADAPVVGYLPSAAGVLVQSMDAEWTKVKSGDITGYVKTDYLAFGDKAEELKSVYGVQGAVASWNDVKVFSDHEDTSSIIGTINEGEGFEIVGSSDSWVEILLDDGRMAYVAAEDVDITTVLDTAVATDESVPAASDAADSIYYEPAEDMSYSEEAVYESGQEYYTEDTYTAEEYTDTYAVDAYSAESYTDTYSETYTTDTYTAESYAPQTESYETYAQTDASGQFNDGVTGDEYINPETEAAAAESSASASAASTVSSSDLDLLAAIIYCEAGNQSTEGKVAVGQVVMNRVASDVYPDTIKDVVYQGGQFTPAGSGWLDQVIGSAPSDCYEAAAAALNGEGSVPDALYFNGGSGKGVQIGAHQFY